MGTMTDVRPEIKLKTLAVVAKRNGWHGRLYTKEVDGQEVRFLECNRNDEHIEVRYTGNTMTYGQYSIFGKRWTAHCASVVQERLEGWPDIIKLFKWFPSYNRPTLSKTYVRLPFDWDEPNDSIMSKLIGHSLYWYSHEGNKINVDIVLVPKTSTSKNFRIVDVNHRKLFHFMGAQSGFRSVLLDTVLKVA